MTETTRAAAPDPADGGTAETSTAFLTAGTDAAMRALGRRIAALLRPGDLLILSGPLGAGKTTLAQGIGEGLDVRGPITSPTFVISRVHPPLSGGPALVHADAYRLGGADELDDLDLDTGLDESVTVVEWGEGVAEGLTDRRLEITIARRADDTRGVTLTGFGARWSGIALDTH